MVEICTQIQIAQQLKDQIYQFHQDRIEMDQVNSIMEVRPRRTAAIILDMEQRFLLQRIIVKFRTIISSGQIMELTLVDKGKLIFN